MCPGSTPRAASDLPGLWRMACPHLVRPLLGPPTPGDRGPEDPRTDSCHPLGARAPEAPGTVSTSPECHPLPPFCTHREMSTKPPSPGSISAEPNTLHAGLVPLPNHSLPASSRNRLRISDWRRNWCRGAGPGPAEVFTPHGFKERRFRLVCFHASVFPSMSSSTWKQGFRQIQNTGAYKIHWRLLSQSHVCSIRTGVCAGTGLQKDAC